MNIESNSTIGVQNRLKELEQKFYSSDSDGNGAVSNAEFKESVSDKGLPESSLDKIFSKLDSDGDGEISPEEHQTMLRYMEDRMASFSSSSSNAYGVNFETNGFDSLMESLKSSTVSEAEGEKLNTIEQQLNSSDFQQQQKGMASLNGYIPKIDELA